jgi:hypothetical protein
VQSSFKLSRSSDFNTDLLYLLTQLMMAQAQEVFCYKAILEKKSDSIIAKLAAHAAKVYGQTAAAMAGVRAIDKSWKIVTEAKSAYHAAEADYRQALTLEEDDQYGQAVAYLRRAATQASTAERIGRQVKFQSPKALIATIQEALELAEHRSHIVYVQVIPDYKTWPLVEGHALAVADRPLPNFCVSEIMGEDLFSGISPASANTPADNIQHPKRSGSTGGKPSPAELRQNVADHSRKPSNRRSPSRGVSSGVGPVVHPSKSEARHDSARAIQQSKTWHIVIAAVIAVAAVMWFGWSSGSSDSAGPALEVLVPHGMLASERSMWNQTCSKKNGPIKFNGCTPTRCGRFVRDGLVSASEVAGLRRIALEGMKLGGADGGPTILDLHSGALSHGTVFIDVYAKAAHENKGFFIVADFAVYSAVKDRVRDYVAAHFSAANLQLTKPTFFSRIVNKPAKTKHDEYWHWHVDKIQYNSFDFTGGQFEFDDEDDQGRHTIRVIEPRAGRLSCFTSGHENVHRVAQVLSGERLAITISFTCDPKSAISNPTPHRS